MTIAELSKHSAQICYKHLQRALTIFNSSPAKISRYLVYIVDLLIFCEPNIDLQKLWVCNMFALVFLESTVENLISTNLI